MSDSTTRRTFLVMLAAGTASGAVAGLSGCAKVSGRVAAGNVADLPEGTLRAVGDEPVAIGRDAAGVYAVTLVCTHLQCSIAEVGSVGIDELHCQCHDSYFDGDGIYLEGPADSDLDNFAVEIDDDGELVIDTDVPVAVGTRLEV